jgi:guanylate kinase
MNNLYHKDNFLIVVSAPSGGGKTTICKAILERMRTIDYSISFTTRKPRHTETNGVDYFFVSEEKFQKLIEAGDFLEYAQVHGNWYGTSHSFIKHRFAQKSHVIMDIDVQGAESIIRSGIDCVTIFLLPPNLQTLENRLRKRNTDSEEMIKIRLDNAKKEIEKIPEYQYLVINDRLDEAIEDVQNIIRAEENSTKRYKNQLAIFYGG